MIIYDIHNNKILDATLTEGAEHEQELGRSDLVRLSWQSDVKLTLPAGAYIIPFEDGLKYRLLNAYTPTEDDKAFKYTPEFQHPLMWLSRVPFLYDTTDADKNPIKQQEWSFDGLTTNALEYACKAINEALNITTESEKFTFTLCGNVDSSVSFSVSSNDILSVLSSIAQACKINSCEWHLSWKHKALYFGQISINLGEEVPTLKAHDNVQVPNISESKENYYNCFYPQGSTKNMSTKALVGTGNVATLARLGLNKSDYPDGCIYVGTDGNVITKEAFEASGEIKQTLALSFDDVYPHIDLYVYNVRKHVRFLKNSQTNQVELDSKGNKKTYTIWYMRLAYPSVTKIDGKTIINTTHDKDESGNIIIHYWYDYEIERTKQVLQGYTLKGIFKVNTHATDGQYDALTQGLVGQPNGQDGFELHYHDINNPIEPKPNEGDSGISILKGDYEIIKYQSGDTIIPTNESEGLYPRGKDKPDYTCNMVVLFNIVMGEHETKLAQAELAARTIKEINRRTQDNNNYSFVSNAVAFAERNPNLYIGQKVVFDDGQGYQLKTRVIKLITKLDYPIIQEIVVGNQTSKGTISQLKDDVNNILSGNFSGAGLNSEQTSTLVKNYTDRRFLHKDIPDTAQAVITFLKGLNIGNDYSINELGEAVLKAITSANYNALEQSGFGITQTKDGKYQLNISDLNVWRKAVFNEIEKRKLSYVGGNFVFSACGSKIKKIVPVDKNGKELVMRSSYLTSKAKYIQNKGKLFGYFHSGDASRIAAYRCYFYQDDGTTATTNLWDVDDLARCQTFNIKAGVYQGVANRNYWRKVVAKGDDYIDLSKTDCEQGSDVPLSGDTLVQFGNRTKTDRQNIIEILTTGDEAPAIVWYAGVNSYSLEGKSTSVISPKKVEFDTNLFRLITRSGARVPLITDRGAWLATEKYGYYDRVSDNGRLWLCIAQGKEVTSRPSDNNPDWQLQVDKGTNGTSEKTYIRYSDDNGATFTKAIPLKVTGDMFAGRNIFAIANSGILAEAGAILDSSIRGVKCTKTKSLNRVGQLFKRFASNLPRGKFRISGRLKTDSTTFSVNVNMGGVNAGDVTATPNWQPFNLLVNNPGYSDAPNYCFVDFRYGMTQPAATALNLYVADLMITQGEEEYEYAPAPEDLQFGLTTGKYIGIASWNKPYPPLNPSAYTWSAFKGEDGKDAEIYRLKASKESAKVTADGLLICDAAYTIEHVQGTSVEVITSEGAAGNKPYVSAHTDKGVNVSVTAGVSNTILYKLNGYFDLASRPDNIIVELYIKVGGSAKIIDTRVIPILMEAMSYTRMVRDMRENISANGRDISTIRQTANSVSVKVNNTEARLENGDFVVKSDTTKFVGADGQKKVLIKDGKVSAELIDAKQIVAEGIQGNTIDAKNATFNNVNVSGTLKGVSGTFRQLQCENYIPGEDPTTLMFDSEGKFLIRDGDLIMSSQSQRKPRLIPVNTWVMGTFGAKRRTTMVVKGTTADFYLNDVKASPYTQTLEIKSTTDGDIYEVPCFCYDNSGHTIYEFPVDTIVFNINSASTFRYELVMYDTQRCMVINANDKADNVYIYSNGVPVRWDGGEVAEVIKLPITMLTPKVPAEFTGAGLMVGAFRDNNWGNLKNIGGV